MREQITAIVNKETEPEIDEGKIKPKTSPDFAENDIKVLRALNHPTYTWRSLSGICADTGLERTSAHHVLRDLSHKGFIFESFTKKNREYKWGLTSKGREFIHASE